MTMQPTYNMELKIFCFAMCLPFILMISSCSSNYVKRAHQKISRHNALRPLEPLLQYSWRIEGLQNMALLNGKTAEIVVVIRNEGPGIAKSVAVKILGLVGNNVTICKHLAIGNIMPKEIKYVHLPFEVTSEVSSCRLLLKLQIEEARGHCPPESEKIIKLEGKENPEPVLELSGYIGGGNDNNVLEAGELALLTIRVKNRGKGLAKDLVAVVSGAGSNSVFLQKTIGIGDIKPGNTKFTRIAFSVPSNVKAEWASIEVKIRGANCQKPIKTKKMVILKRKKTPKLKLECSCEIKGTNEEGVIEEGKSVTIAVRIKNEGESVAKDLEVRVSGIKNIGKLFPEEVFLDDLFSGDIRIAYFTLKVKKKIEMETALIRIDIIGSNENTLKTLVKQANLRHKRQCLTLKSANQNLKIPMSKKEPNAKLASKSEKRASMKYWELRLRHEPKNPHILCQVAKATLAERGELGVEAAKEYYQQALNLDSVNLEAYIGIVDLLLQQEEYPLAEKFLKQALSAGLVHYKLYYYLGKIYSLSYDPWKAIRYYSLAVKENPNCIECLYSRGEEYKIVLKPRSARADFEVVKRIAAPTSFYHRGAVNYLGK